MAMNNVDEMTLDAVANADFLFSFETEPVNYATCPFPFGLPNDQGICAYNAVSQFFAVNGWSGFEDFHKTESRQQRKDWILSNFSGDSATNWTDLECDGASPTAILLHKASSLTVAVAASKTADVLLNWPAVEDLEEVQSCVCGRTGHALCYARDAFGDWWVADDGYVSLEEPEISEIIFFTRRKLPEAQGAGQSTPRFGNADQSGNSGTVVNNYYANLYQNSIDLDALPTTSVGAPGNSQSNNSTNNNSLSNAFSSVANLATTAFGMLLDHKTEETTNLEDRVVTTKIGASTLNTQSSVGMTRGYGPPASIPPTSVADLPTTGTESMERAYTKKLGTWTTSDQVWSYLILNLPDYSDHKFWGVFGRTLDSHSFCKNGWEVMVQANASQFHSGALYVGLIPEFPTITQLSWTDWHTSVEMDPHQLTLFPHQFLNIRTNTSAHIEVPYANFAPTSSSRIHYPWSLLVVIVAPLQVPDGASPNVDIAVSVAPKDIVMNGIRNPSVASQSLALSEADKMFLTTAPTRATPAVGKTVVPGCNFIPGEVTNLLQVARIPTLCNLPDGKPYIKVDNTITTSPVLSMDVTLSSKHLASTYVAGLAEWFAQYRGSIQLDFMFVGSAASRGKFVISYTPPGGNEPSSVEEAMQGTYTIWDLGLNSTLSFLVPYISASDFRYTFSGSEVTALSVDGWIQIFKLTPLTYPAGSVTEGKILVFASAGSDFCFRFPVTPATQAGEGVSATGNAESGATVDLQSEVELASFDAHTDVRYLAERFWHFYVRSSDRYFATPNWAVLDLLAANNPLSRFLKLFTYYKCDLGITIIPNAARSITSTTNNNSDGTYYTGNVPDSSDKADLIRAIWLPNGARQNDKKYEPQFKAPGNTNVTVSTPLAATGPNPVAYTRVSTGLNAITFEVPYSSPFSAIPTAYCGYKNWSRTDFGKAPGSNFGALAVSSTVNGLTYEVRVRLNRFRAFMPRPTDWDSESIVTTEKADREKAPIFEITPATGVVAQGLSNFDMLKQCGDVESNPGPGTFSKILESVESFTQVQDILKLMKESLESPSVWIKLAKFLVRALMFLRILLKGNDPVLAMLALADLGLTSLSFREVQDKIVGIFRKTAPVKLNFQLEKAKETSVGLLEKIKNFMSGKAEATCCCTNPFCPGCTPQSQAYTLNVQAEASTLQTFNNLFTGAKNIEWAYKLFASVVNWLRDWLGLGKLDELKEFQKELKKFPIKLRDARGTKDYTWFRDMHARAAALNQPAIANLLERQIGTDADNGRPEPVVVVLRGAAGQGKSLLANILAKNLSIILSGKESIWSCPPDAKYFDGYTGQHTVIIDDLGQNPDGADYSYFTQMVSSTDFRPPMAAVSDKGIRFTSPLIIATTNMPTGYHPRTLNSHAALTRRFTFDLIIGAMPEYSKGDKHSGPVTLDFFKATAMDTKKEGSRFNAYMPLLDQALGWKKTPSESFKPLNVEHLMTQIADEVRSRKRGFTSLDKLVAQDGIANIDECVASSFFDTCPTAEMLRAYLRAYSDFTPVDCEVVVEWWKQSREVSSYTKFLKDAVLAIGLLALLIGIFRSLWSWKKESDLYKKLFDDVPEQEQTDSDDEETPTPPVSKKQEKELTRSIEAAYGALRKAKPKKTDLEIRSQGSGFVLSEQKAFMKNCRPAHFYTDDGVLVSSITAYGIKGFICTVSRHVWNLDWDYFYIGETRYTRDKVTSLSVKSPENGEYMDVIFLNLHKGTQFKDKSAAFVSHTAAPLRGSPLFGLVNNQHIGKIVFSASFLGNGKMINTTDGYRFPHVVAYNASTEKGYCGSPIVARIGGKLQVLGIHSAGDGTHGYATTLTKKLIDSVLSQFGPASEGFEPLPDGPRVHISRKTALRKTVAKPVFNPPFEPAVLSQNDPRLNDGVVLDEAVRSKLHHEHPTDPANLEWLTMGAQAYANTLFSVVGYDNQPLSYDEALDGIEGLDAMDANTSPGYPFVLAGLRRPDLMNPEGQLIGEAAALYKKFKSGDYSDHIFQSFLKDEIRKTEKVATGATRVVDVSSFPHVIVGRELLGRLAAKMHLNHGVGIGSAVGCNPDTYWTFLYHQLSQFKHVYAVDYKAFDSTHSPQMFETVIQHVLTPENGFSPDVADFLRSLCNSVHAYGEKRYRITGGLPSGCSCTSILNTIFNNVVVRAAFYKAFKNYEEGDFIMVAYGDDLVIASDYNVDFNMLKPIFRDFGYTITPEDKSTEFHARSLSDISFLKRSFVLDPVTPLLVRPRMDSSVLEGILSYYRPGTMEEKLQSVSLLAVHSGPTEYKRLFRPFVEAGFKVPSYLQVNRQWYDQFL